MKHQRSIISIAMATIMLISLCAVVCTTGVSAATSSSASTSQWNIPNVPSGAIGSSGILGTPAVCAQDANSLDLFVQGTDNALWWIHKDSWLGWSAWKSLGGHLTAGPAAISRGAGDLMVFVRGTNGAIYTKSSTDGGATWSTNWGNIGGQALDGTGPAASRWGSDGYAIFVTGTNHQVYLKSWTSTGGWVDWRSIGGYVTSSPGAAWGDALHVEVLARGSNGNCYLTSTGNGGTTWTCWMNFGGVLLAGTGPGIIWVTAFVTGTNHQLYWYVISSGWTPLGGYLTSGPGVAQRSSTAWDVFVRGKDGSIYWMAFFDNDWHDWIRLSGPP